MIATWAVVQVERPRARAIRLWLPLWVLWLLLLPLVPALLALLALWSLVRRTDPFPPIGAALAVLCSLRGTTVEIQHEHASVLMRLV